MAQRRRLDGGDGAVPAKLGSIIYVIPFFFALNPALIGEGPPFEIALTLGTALLGVWLIGSGLQGYAAGFGTLGDGPLSWLLRVVLVTGGLFFAAPGGVVPGLGHFAMSGLGPLLAAPTLLWLRTRALNASAVAEGRSVKPRDAIRTSGEP